MKAWGERRLQIDSSKFTYSGNILSVFLPKILLDAAESIFV